jgi:hypothetical protein
MGAPARRTSTETSEEQGRRSRRVPSVVKPLKLKNILQMEEYYSRDSVTAYYSYEYYYSEEVRGRRPNKRVQTDHRSLRGRDTEVRSLDAARFAAEVECKMFFCLTIGSIGVVRCFLPSRSFSVKFRAVYLILSLTLQTIRLSFTF